MDGSFFDAFRAGQPAACALLEPAYRDRAAWSARARAAAGRGIARELCVELAAQQAELPESAARRAHLAALEGGAAVVVTGQQVGLFGGPLYTLHKAASAVAWARAIEAASGVRCVPLFWLQTEDHDYEEVRRCTVLGAAGPIELALGDEAPRERRVSLAHRALGGEVAGELDRLAEALAPLPHADETVALLRAAYSPGRSIGGAFAHLIGALFAPEGLVVLDPRRPAVARLAVPIYRRAIGECETIAAELRARGAAIEAAGFSPQVPVRERACLLFHHLAPDGEPSAARGPRFRLERREGGWALAGDPRPVDQRALDGALERDPLALSTSALLRPLVQDALLPVAAYVAGPSELAYFAQLPPLYARLGVAPALVAPRARIALFDRWAAAQCDRLGVALDVAAADPAALAARDAPGGVVDAAALRARLVTPLARELDALAADVPARDRVLQRALRRTRETIDRAAARLAGHLARAAGQRDQAAAERARRAVELLAPGGVPQERAYNFAGFAARAGVRRTVEVILGAIAPPTGALVGARL